MVVILVFGIVVLIAYPRLSSLAPAYRLEGAARSLAVEIQNARARAIAEGRCLRVVFDSAARTYQVQSKPGITPCGTSGFAADGAVRAIEESRTIGIEDPTNPGNTPASPILDSRGRGESVSSIRLFNVAGGARVIFVQQSGRVYVQ